MFAIHALKVWNTFAAAGEFNLYEDPTIHQALEQDPDLDTQSLQIIERALAAAGIDPDGTDEGGVFRSLPYRAFQEAPFYLSSHLAAAAFDAARHLPPFPGRPGLEVYVLWCSCMPQLDAPPCRVVSMLSQIAIYFLMMLTT
jgi:hypothetical protein